MKSLKFLFLTRKVGLYLRWGSIVSKPFFDWGLLGFEWDEVLFKSGVAFKLIWYPSIDFGIKVTLNNL